MSLSFKAFLYERNWRGFPVETRRFNVDQDVLTSFAYLVQKVSQVFPSVTPGNVSVAWRDTDGDFITLSSDDELVEALGQFDGTIFKLYLLKKNTSDTTQTAPPATGETTEENSTDPQPGTSEGQQQPHQHFGVICDGCGSGPITGTRYKCLVCDDYDLCSACEGKGVHVDHNMITITEPGSYNPWGFHGWGGRGRGGRCGRRGGWRHHGQGRPSCHGGRWGGPPHGGFGHPQFPFGGFQPSFGGFPPFGGAGQPPCPLWGILGGAGCSGFKGGCGQSCGGKAQEPSKEQPGSEPMDTEQSAEDQRRAHVRNIGEAVSNFLQPFGIKVDVDVAGGEEKKATDDTTASGEAKPSGGASATPEVPSDVIEQALAQLKAMGHEDEGGWLTELIKAKGGDVSKVLDALHFTETD